MAMGADKWSKKIIREWLIYRGFLVCERFSLDKNVDELSVYDPQYEGWRSYRSSLRGFRDALYDAWLSTGAGQWGDCSKDTPRLIKKRVSKNDGMDIRVMISKEPFSESKDPIPSKFDNSRSVRQMIAKAFTMGKV